MFLIGEFFHTTSEAVYFAIQNATHIRVNINYNRIKYPKLFTNYFVNNDYYCLHYT